MPAHQDLWRDNRCDFREQFSPRQPGFDREAAALIVREAKAEATKLNPKDAIFLPQIPRNQSPAALQKKDACRTSNHRHARNAAEMAPKTVQRGPGRPVTQKEIEALVVRMATENRDWGYLRIQGTLSNPAHALARTTIANI
jgi:hypothetical protein